jgi:hypothetical protein
MNDIPENVVGVIAILTVFIAFPIVIVVARAIWKRSSEGPAPKSVGNDDVVRRIAQLQQSMDSMAVEIERISEGQRFVTKLMSERPPAELRTKN